MKLNLLLATFLFFLCNAQAQIPTNGLLLHYNFNGNVNDQSGNGYNASTTGTAYRYKGPLASDSALYNNATTAATYYDYSAQKATFETQDYSCVAYLKLDSFDSNYGNILEVGDPTGFHTYFRFRRSGGAAVLESGHYSSILANGNYASILINPDVLWVSSLYDCFQTQYND
jgi:hypothetical protein